MAVALPQGKTSVQGSYGDGAFEQPSNSKSTAVIEASGQVFTRNSSKPQRQSFTLTLSVLPHESGGVMTAGGAVTSQRLGQPACAGEAKSRATVHAAQA